VHINSSDALFQGDIDKLSNPLRSRLDFTSKGAALLPDVPEIIVEVTLPI
jgi:hypothetical protein